MTQIGLTTYVEVIQVTPLLSSFNISNVILGVSRWQNPGNRFDVLDDGVVDINDYNAIINYITSHGSGVLPKNRPTNQPYVDVNGDGGVTNQDVSQLLAYLQSKKLIDTTPTKGYDISDFKIQRDLLNPITVTTVKDVAAQKNIFPTSDYLIFSRDLSTNDLTEITYTTAVASRDSLVFINKNVIVPVHPWTPGCYNDSCVFRLIKSRIAASEILPIRFNKTVGTVGVAAGTGLPMPGTDTSEMPPQPTVAEVITPTPIVVVPPTVLLDLFPSPCAIIGEVKLVCTSANGSANSGIVTCTAKMTSNTTPAPYVASADSEHGANNPTYLGQYFFKSYRYGVLQISTTLDPATQDFYHWIGGDYEINWALSGGDDPARMAGFIDPRTIPGAYLICLEDQPGPRSSVFDACVLVVPQPNGTVKCLQNGESDHTYQHKLFGPNGSVLFDPFAHGDVWYTYDVAASDCPAWKAFNQTNVDAGDQWESDTTAFPHYLQYDFNSAVVVNKYAIRERNSADYTGFPSSFTLQGSNDDINWVVLDTRAGTPAPGPNSWSAYFTFSNSTAYRYYRLNVSAVIGGGSRTNIAELKLVCYSIGDNANTSACTTAMSSNTIPVPNVVSASSEYYSEYRGEYYSAWMAFNQTNLGESDRWISAASVAPWYIQYDFGAGFAVPINKYAIQEQNYDGTAVVNGTIINEQDYNSGDGFPRNFMLQGSNDATNWTTLDTRINIDPPGVNAWSDWFTFSNGTVYRYYRIYITAVNGQLPMPIVAPVTPSAPSDCVIVSSSDATVRGVVITQYNESERTTPEFQTAGQTQTTLYSNQDLWITFNAYDANGVYIAELWLDGVKVPITTGPNQDTRTGGVNFGVAIGKRAAGVHNYSIVATNNNGVVTTPPYACWFTVLGGA